MMPNIDENSISDMGEIFSHAATSENDEKIVKNTAGAQLPDIDTEGRVTLISEGSQPCHAAEKTPFAEYVHDLRCLTKMQLRKKYRREETSHRNMLTRSKRRGDKVHPSFREFRSFLRIVGPMPVSGATLDRIDNADREYAPGKVRWADKRTQNNNKGDTVIFYDQRTGEVFTASRLAKLQGVTASAIRRRLARGWSDAEIIAGFRSFCAPVNGREPPLTPSWKVDPTVGTIAFNRTQSKSVQQILFDDMAADFARARANGEEEPLLASHHILNEGLPDGTLPVTEEKWLARFERFWPDYRRHVIFERASKYHQRAIELIDPDYVKNERAKVIQQGEAKTKL